MSMHESETRMDHYQPRGPLSWESDDQGTPGEADLAPINLQQPSQGTVKVPRLSNWMMDEDPRLISPKLPPWTLCGGLVMPYRLEPPLSWDGWDSTIESSKPGTEPLSERTPSPTADGGNPLNARTNGPARGFCGGIEEHPYRIGPTLSWDDVD
jgi:hypothetical protein